MRFFYLAVIGCAICSASALQARAGAFLMSTTGAGNFNGAQAVALGNTVNTSALSSIVAMTPAALSSFDVVWVNPYLNSDAYYDLSLGVVAGGSLEQYVSNGGTLVLNVAGNSGNWSDVAPGGVDFVGGTTTPNSFHNSEVFSTPAHPYLTGAGYSGVMLEQIYFTNWRDTDHGILTGLLPGTATVLEYGFGCGPTFIQYDYGCGTVIVDTLSYGWGSTAGVGARGPALDNLIKYALYASTQTSCDCNCTPEPSSFALFGLGACFGAFGLVRRRSCGVAYTSQ